MTNTTEELIERIDNCIAGKLGNEIIKQMQQLQQRNAELERERDELAAELKVHLERKVSLSPPPTSDTVRGGGWRR